MAHDWAADVKKYVASTDDVAIKGIIKHCGIALQKEMPPLSLAPIRPSATVSATAF